MRSSTFSTVGIKMEPSSAETTAKNTARWGLDDLRHGQQVSVECRVWTYGGVVDGASSQHTACPGCLGTFQSISSSSPPLGMLVTRSNQLRSPTIGHFFFFSFSARGPPLMRPHLSKGVDKCPEEVEGHRTQQRVEGTISTKKSVCWGVAT